MALAINQSNFQEIVSGDKLVVADFWAEWCSPCKMLGPIVDEISTEYEGKAIVGKVNVEEEQDLAVQYGVRSIPTVIFLKNGEVVDKHVGFAQKSALTDIINKHLN